MEAAKLYSGGIGERGSCGGPKVSVGVWAAVSSAGSPVVHWTQGAARVRPRWSPSWSAIGAADHIGVRSRGCFPAAENPLDVVASDRRAGHRLWRAGGFEIGRAP